MATRKKAADAELDVVNDIDNTKAQDVLFKY